MELSIDIIKNFCLNNKLRWTNHIFLCLVQRNISIADVKNTLLNGEIIVQYPNDYPYPSCLILGLSVNNKYVHVVCGSNGKELYLITAYYPDKNIWTDDFKKRKEC